MGYLAELLEKDEVELVGINKVRFVQFISGRPVRGQHVALGVRGFSACSVVVVISDYAAILAHVAMDYVPEDPRSRPLDSFLNLAHETMQEFEKLYFDNRSLFPGGTTGTKAYTLYSERHDMRSRSQEHIFEEYLTKWRIQTIKTTSYPHSSLGQISNESPKGTVFVGKPPGRPPMVCYEDTDIAITTTVGSPRAQGAQAVRSSPARSSPPAAGPSQTSSSRASVQRGCWTFDEGRPGYRFVDDRGNVVEERREKPVGVWMWGYDRYGTCR